MSRSATLGFALLIAATTAIAEPFTAEHLVRADRVQAPEVSPDGARVVYAVRHTDMEANKGRYDLWLSDLAGGEPLHLTTHEGDDKHPAWSPDGRFVLFLSDRGGATQVWRIPVDGGEARPVTDLPLDISSFRLAPTGDYLVVSMSVYLDCPDIKCTVKRNAERDEARAGGQAYDKLFIRHWDKWLDDRRSQLFAISLDESGIQNGTPVRLSLIDADIPSRVRGGNEEYAISPDGRTLYFSARLRSRTEPLSTNFDIYSAPIHGDGQFRNLTVDNKAWDARPAISPDGKYLAYLAMSRPGFEADRYRVVLRDLGSGESRVLTEDWDRSPDSLAFTRDGTALLLTAQDTGQKPLFRLALDGGTPEFLVSPAAAAAGGDVAAPEESVPAGTEDAADEGGAAEAAASPGPEAGGGGDTRGMPEGIGPVAGMEGGGTPETPSPGAGTDTVGNGDDTGQPGSAGMEEAVERVAGAGQPGSATPADATGSGAAPGNPETGAGAAPDAGEAAPAGPEAPGPVEAVAEVAPVRRVPSGTVDGFDDAGDHVVYAMNSLVSPNEIHVLDKATGESRQVTHFGERTLADVEMGEPEQFSFAGAGGESVYGYVVRPAGFEPGRRYPVAFLIHGGPQGSFSNHFHYRWNPQTYAGQGFAAVMIDFHGSSGYGQAFTDSITGDWGGKPLEDLKLGLAAALARYRFLDGERVCALGASYGGYMVNWIAGQWPDRFRCLVEHDGLFDNRAMYYTTEELWFPEWEFGGPYYEQETAYENYNPVNYVELWQTPMLVIHGQLDYRVPLTQGIATFTALQRRGIESRFLYFPDENHWVQKPGNSLQWHAEVNAWLHRFLDE